MELSFYLPKGSYATELIGGDFTLIFKCFLLVSILDYTRG